MKVDCKECNPINNVFARNNKCMPKPEEGVCSITTPSTAEQLALDFCRDTPGDNAVKKCVLLKLPHGKSPQDFVLEGTNIAQFKLNGDPKKLLASDVLIKGIHLASLGVISYGLHPDSPPASSYVLRLNGAHVSGAPAFQFWYWGGLRVENSYLDHSDVRLMRELPDPKLKDAVNSAFRNVVIRNNFFDRTYGKPVTVYGTSAVIPDPLAEDPVTRFPASLHKLAPLCQGIGCDTSLTLYSGAENFEQWTNWNRFTFNTLRHSAALNAERLMGWVLAYNHYSRGGIQEGIVDGKDGCNHCLIYHNWVQDNTGQGLMFYGGSVEDTVIADNQLIRAPGIWQRGAGPDNLKLLCGGDVVDAAAGCNGYTYWGIRLEAGPKGVKFPDKAPVCNEVTIENNLIAQSVFGGMQLSPCKALIVRNNTVTSFWPEDESSPGADPSKSFKGGGSGLLFAFGPYWGDYDGLKLIANVAMDSGHDKFLGLGTNGNSSHGWLNSFPFDGPASHSNYFQGCAKGNCNASNFADPATNKPSLELHPDTAVAYSNAPASKSLEADDYHLEGLPESLTNLDCLATKQAVMGPYKTPGFNYLDGYCPSSQTAAITPLGSELPAKLFETLEVAISSVNQSGCSENGQCGAGLYCINSKCSLPPIIDTACNADADCDPCNGEHEGCNAAIMRCVEDPETQKKSCQDYYGIGCKDDSECKASDGTFLFCKKDEGQPKGICVGACEGTRDCAKQDDCWYRNFTCRVEGDKKCHRLLLLENGEPCATSDQCQTGHCVDEVCCDTACDAGCEACNLLTKEGSQALAGTCGVLPAETICRASDVGNPCDQAEVCDGAAAICPDDGFKPDDASCQLDGSAGICSAGFCAALAKGGEFCGFSGDCESDDCIEMKCESSYYCVNEVCCNLACDGPCDTCRKANGAPADGTCGTRSCPQPSECQAEGVCLNAEGGCTYENLANTTLCGGGSGTCQEGLCATGTGKEANGYFCIEDNQCDSGHCAPSWSCCDTACNGPCQVCDPVSPGAVNPGLCQVLPDGSECNRSPGTCLGGVCIAPSAAVDAGMPVDGTVDTKVPADASVDAGMPADATVDSTSIDATLDSTAIDATVDTTSIDATVDTTSIDATVDSTSIDATVDGMAIDATVDTTSIDATVDSTSIDATVDSVSSKAQGEACGQTSECTQGLACVDAVCCDTTCGGGSTSDCEACSVAMGAPSDGTCAPVLLSYGLVCSPGVDACDLGTRCDGSGTICPASHNYFATGGTGCDDLEECTTGETCDGAGTCNVGSPVTNGTACTGGTCQGGVCVAGKALGATCSAGGECLSGNCIDSVCCNTACGGGVADDCQACSVAAGGSSDGTCDTGMTGPSCDTGSECSTGSCSAGSCDVTTRIAYNVACTGGACDGFGSCVANPAAACSSDANCANLDNDCVVGWCYLAPSGTCQRIPRQWAPAYCMGGAGCGSNPDCDYLTDWCGVGSCGGGSICEQLGRSPGTPGCSGVTWPRDVIP